MTFYEFITKKYLKSDSPKGDLAKDIHQDEYFPKHIDTTVCLDGSTIESHLEMKGACYDAIKIFKSCWKQYLRNEEKIAQLGK